MPNRHNDSQGRKSEFKLALILLILALLISAGVFVWFKHGKDPNKIQANPEPSDIVFPSLEPEPETSSPSSSASPSNSPTTQETPPNPTQHSTQAPTREPAPESTQGPTRRPSPTKTESEPIAPSARKRGLAGATTAKKHPESLKKLGVGWYYNWSVKRPNNPPVEWVPMLWGPNAVSDKNIAMLKKGKEQGHYSALLGFNEPDHPKQANMTVKQAIELWPKLESTGLRLGSPAPMRPNGVWFDNFMKQAEQRGLRVDFIALHYYQDFTSPNAVKSLEKKLRKMYQKYHKPIWITEIGTLDIRTWGYKHRTAPTSAKAQKYMQEVTEMLERLPFVERYSWFKDSCQPGASQTKLECNLTTLYDDKGELTQIGRLYAQTTQPASKNTHVPKNPNT